MFGEASADVQMERNTWWEISQGLVAGQTDVSMEPCSIAAQKVFKELPIGGGRTGVLSARSQNLNTEKTSMFMTPQATAKWEESADALMGKSIG